MGGGIGTVNLIRGLKQYTDDFTAIISMADDGGSTGRLRRLYGILPPGDLVSCMAAASNDPLLAKVLTYRFPGNRYGKDEELVGQKLGSLIMVGMRDVTGGFDEAIHLFQKVFGVPGHFFPATTEPVSISAKTVEGKQVHREENIDLGRYVGKKQLDQVFLHPKDAKPSVGVIASLQSADAIIVGPGDLYTTILPTLIIPAIREELTKSKKKKIFVVNVANKPSETKGYTVSDYIKAIEKHLGMFPFDIVIANNNVSIPIPSKFRKSYRYVPLMGVVYKHVIFVEKDLVDEAFPLYHSPEKLAKVVLKHI